VAVPDIESLVSPWVAPTLWDSLVISGVSYKAPADGWFQITGATRSYRWDVKDGAGLQGAIETYRGRTPPQFTITFYIWTDEQYTATETFLRGLFYDPTKLTIQPYTVYHPTLDNLGIYQIIIEEIGGITKSGDWQQGPDMFTAVVRCREFFPLIAFPQQTPDAAADKNQAPQLSGDIQNQQQIQSKLTEQIRNAGDPLGLFNPPQT